MVGSLADTFRRALQRAGVTPQHSRLAVALSGGPDSMALASLTRGWQLWSDAKEVPLALVVDHRLRPESSDEAAGVAERAAALGLQPHTLEVDWGAAGLPRPGDKMAAAREARYSLLLSRCEALGVSHLLVAHHADDQAETFLLRLLHASGIQGLACMRPVSRWPAHPGVAIVRPLLEVHKQELVRYCDEQGLSYVTDPTNSDMAFQRNRIRWVLHNAPYPAATEEEAAEEAGEPAAQDVGQGNAAAPGSITTRPEVPQMVKDVLRLQRLCAEVAEVQGREANRLLRLAVLHTSAPGLPHSGQQEAADEESWPEQQRGSTDHSERLEQHHQAARWQQEQQEQQQQQQQPVGELPQPHQQKGRTHRPGSLHWPTVLLQLADALGGALGGQRFSLLHVAPWGQAEESAALVALSRVLQATAGRQYPPSLADRQRLWRRLRSGKLEGGWTGGGCLVRPVTRSKGQYALCVPRAAQQQAEDAVRAVIRAAEGKSIRSGGTPAAASARA